MLHILNVVLYWAHMWNNELARQKLKDEGRTTAWLAKQCGLEVTSMRNVLQGRKPSSPVIKLMALALGLKEADLLNPSAKTA